MHMWGKILGFLFGFMLSKHLLGALLGMWLGHKFDKKRSEIFTANFGEAGATSTLQNIFFYTSFSVMGYIAKANGRVTQQEIAFASAYMHKLNLSNEMKEQAKEAFRDGKTLGFPLEEHLNAFVKACGHRQDVRLMFLEIQIQVAFVDGDLDEHERKALHTIAHNLGYSKHDLDKLLEMIIAGEAFHQQAKQTGTSSSVHLNNAYKLLGVSKDATAKDIKKAHRKLMSQHHPDKLVSKGLPPEMMEIAKQKAQDIQAAYELILKSM